jgi:signal transduction histidine kinase
VAIAVALAVLGELEIWLSDVEGPRWPSASAAILCALPLAWRRRAPVAVVVASTGVIAAQFLLGVDSNGPSVPLLVIVIATYTLGERATTRDAVLGGAFAIGSLWVVLLDSDVATTDFWFSAVLVLAPIMLGRVLGATRREAAATARRAEVAVAEERSRIARELHDIVSHSISVMGIQAGAARRRLEPGQDDVREALLSVEAVGRQALNEMRRLLGVLRQDQGPLAMAPQPGLGDLGDLVAEARSAGQAIELHFEADERPLAPGIDLAAYRIVQEALTNVRKHAAAAPATVTVRRFDGALELEVRDDGPGATGPGSGGHGLVGMRERVALYGGELEVVSPPGGGHVVRARLPTEEEAR